jgi:hypothetical protein
MVWLVYHPVHHQVQQREGSKFAAWYTTVDGLASGMGLDIGHGLGCRVQ